MSFSNYSTPLMALNAVVLDTETTGLDASKARLLQVGAIALNAGKLENSQSYMTFVNPNIPIPPSSTQIHGISDDMVKDAPRFADVAPAITDFIDASIVIGHTISFDMMIFRREFDLAGLPCPNFRTLDVRWLARLASRSLAHYDLDGLCKWLNIDVVGRHTALGDADATAKVFLALVPLLREKGIRTLAEAETASGQLAEQETRSAGGFYVAENAASYSNKTLSKLDSFAYKHRVRDVMSAPPVVALHNQSAEDAIKLFDEKKVSSIFVKSQNGEWGIVTERDVLRLLSKDGAKGLKVDLEHILNKPLQTVSDNAFIYRAIGRIERLNIRHLGVRDVDGNIVGVITPRNLLKQKTMTAIVLGDEIDSAQNVQDLGGAWSKLILMARSLIAEDVPTRTISEIISSEVCVLTRKAAQMAEKKMLELGRGAPPARYCVMVLGSAGRGESLLAADQDNAIVFENTQNNKVADAWFEEMATLMNGILDEVGVPLCKGGVMAKNKAWRHSFEEWKSLVEHWVSRQSPEDMLNVDIFFDGIAVHGALELGTALWKYAYECAHQTPDFVKMLGLNMFDGGEAFGLFGGFKTDEHGRLDLKKCGLLPIVASARLLSIRHQILERATPSRYRGLAQKNIGSAEDIEKILQAQEVIMGMMLEQQLRDTEQGVSLTSFVKIERLTKGQKEHLKEALKNAALAKDFANEGRF